MASASGSSVQFPRPKSDEDSWAGQSNRHAVRVMPLGADNNSTRKSKTAWANEINPLGTPTPIDAYSTGSFRKWPTEG